MVEIFFVAMQKTIKTNALKNILYIVIVSVEWFIKIGLIKTMEYVVKIKEARARIIPKNFVFVLFLSLIGKINNDKPKRRAIIAIRVMTDSVSFKKKKPKIADNITGLAKRIEDSIKGDNLDNEAKNKLSPIAIPKIELIPTIWRLLISIVKSALHNSAINSKIMPLKTVLIVAISIALSLFPSFLNKSEQIAQDIAQINAEVIPKRFVFILFDLKFYSTILA